jgi:hypothetical protein
MIVSDLIDINALKSFKRAQNKQKECQAIA